MSHPFSHSPSSRPFPLFSPLYRDDQRSSVAPLPYPSALHMLDTHPTYSSSLSPTMDPSSVDFRAFYPYIPNEVKHRKRTTTTQLKVLEGVFKRDTKPNAALRKELAAELDMSPRGVQVWFQNRRAKEKTRASKTLSRGPGARNLRSTSPFARLSEETDAVPESPSECSPSPTEAAEEPSSQGSSPISPPSLQILTDISDMSWHNSPLDSPRDGGYLAQPTQFDDGQLLAFRRGSLPVDAIPMHSESSYGPPCVDHLDPLTRRRSVDMSLHRLASNPYAPFARAKNALLHGTRSLPQHGCFYPPYMPLPSHGRPNMHHRASMPPELVGHDGRHSSVDLRAFRFTHDIPIASHSVSPFQAVRASMPDAHSYAISSRTVASPLPGPLPSPGFSFGAPCSMPSPCSADSERSSPDAYPNFTFDEYDAEDDATSASYDALSRFGSVTSTATSESSNTSAFYSDVDHHDLEHESCMRQGSCTPGQVLDLMSGLHVNRHDAERHLQRRDSSDSQCGPSAYPSPSSTASPGGGSPHVQDPNPPSIPISTSSELAHALHNQPEQTLDAGTESQARYGQTSVPETDPHGSSQQQYFYQQGLSFPSSDSASGSAIAMPMMEYAEKFQFDVDAGHLSGTGHYHPASYPSPAAEHYSVDVPFVAGEAREDMDLHRAMEFAHTPNGYAPYNANSVDPSVLTEDTLHGAETYTAYS